MKCTFARTGSNQILQIREYKLFDVFKIIFKLVHKILIIVPTFLMIKIFSKLLDKNCVRNLKVVINVVNILRTNRS